MSSWLDAHSQTLLFTLVITFETFLEFTENEEMTDQLFAHLLGVSRNLSSYTQTAVFSLRKLNSTDHSCG